MVRAGISRPIAMDRSGHKTESVFNRYDIGDDKDQQEAAKKLEAYLNSQMVKDSLKIVNFNVKKG
jgi:hypothetical protein